MDAVLDAMDSWNPAVHFLLHLDSGRLEIEFTDRGAARAHRHATLPGYLRIPGRRTAPRGRYRPATREALLRRALAWLRGHGIEPQYELRIPDPRRPTPLAGRRSRR